MDTASDTHSDLDDLWTAGAFDENLDQPEPMTTLWAAAAPLGEGVPQTFETRHAVGLGREAVFDSLLATQDSTSLTSSFDTWMAMRRAAELAQADTKHRLLDQTFSNLGLTPPARPPAMSALGFNLSVQAAYSTYLRQGHGSLEQLIRLHRGETDVDPRPNKALIVPEADFPHKDLWTQVVQHGVVPQWSEPLPRQARPPRNHKSWDEAANLLLPDVAKGQLKGEYLILDGDLVPLLLSKGWAFFSPFGAAEKGGLPLSVAARITHDASHPRKGKDKGKNVNCLTAKVDITMNYDGPAKIAQWALEVESAQPGEAVMMTGDVSGAFRNVPFAAAACGSFAGYIPQLDIVIVNLSLSFGWTDSPAFYWLAGRAIKTIHEQRFMNLVWCDDHILMEYRLGWRMDAAAYSLRRAMVLVLGTQACNDDKFTEWSRRGKALGMIFDFDERTVSMPEAKITKVVGRLLALLSSPLVTAHELRKAMGLLRHVTTCVPVAKPFFHRVQARLCVLGKSAARLPLGAGATEDVHWLLALLRSGALNGIPMSRFTGTAPPKVHIEMDASDWGVCGVWHAQRRYFAIQWDDEEKTLIEKFKTQENMSFSINLRELLGAYFAMVLWAKDWREAFGADTHIRFWIDNTSAVAWAMARSCRHPGAQAVLRVMALLEAANHIYISANHIPGVLNVWADAGSRMWTSPTAGSKFQELNRGYAQEEVDKDWRKPSIAWASYSKTPHSPGQATAPMGELGNNGGAGAD